MTEKAVLRKRILAERRKFFELTAQYAEASHKAQRFLIGSDVWERSQRVALYAPIRGETDTALLAETARVQGKIVLYPRCVRDAGGEPALEFVVCRDRSDLVPGAYGIMEPASSLPAETVPPDMVVVPAVGVDRSGYRLGYGGGYYDRLLARPDWQGVITTGLIFSFQLLNAIPRSAWDKPLCGAVTDRGCVWL